MGKLAKLAKALDMSKEARMARAKEQRVYDNTVYHGTAAKPSTTTDDGNIFEEFKLWEGNDPTRSSVRSPVSKLGVSLAEQPEIAESFARLAASNQKEQTGATLMPLRFRADKMGHIDLDGSETNEDIFGAVTDAWKSDYDAIQFRNYTTPDGIKGSFVLVKNPNQIRSTQAAFDPAKKDSSNLLAGVTGATVGTSAILSDNSQAQDFTQRRASKRDQWKELRERTLGAHPLESFKNPPLIEQTIEAPKSQTLLDMASAAQKYNDFIDKPLINLIAPELPAELWRKQAYGQPTTLGERSLAALAMSPI